MININTSTKISKEFQEKGYVIAKVKDLNKLRLFSNLVHKNLFKKNKIKNLNSKSYFDNLHKKINKKDLNALRMKTIKSMSSNLKAKKIFFELIDEYIYELVGNELAMQKNLNLVIQMPKDKSSIIDLHADTWGGNSPFELVVWLPLVDCFKTKSMFILNRKKNKKHKLEKLIKNKKKVNSEQIFKKIEKDITWLNVKYGEVVLFQPSLPHGGRVNLEKQTRVSINSRFKGLFTPYKDKKIGEYFEPINIKPCSKVGFDYLDEIVL